MQWSGHVERMDEERCVKKKKTGCDERNIKVRGRPRMGWMDSVKRALDTRGMYV